MAIDHFANFANVWFEMDSKVAIKMIEDRRKNSKQLQPLLDDILQLLSSYNRFGHVSHIFREANRCVDLLASYAHELSTDFLILNSPSPSLLKLLMEDARGVSFSHLVAIQLFFIFSNHKKITWIYGKILIHKLSTIYISS